MAVTLKSEHPTTTHSTSSEAPIQDSPTFPHAASSPVAVQPAPPPARCEGSSVPAAWAAFLSGARVPVQPRSKSAPGQQLRPLTSGILGDRTLAYYQAHRHTSTHTLTHTVTVPFHSTHNRCMNNSSYRPGSGHGSSVTRRRCEVRAESVIPLNPHTPRQHHALGGAGGTNQYQNLRAPMPPPPAPHPGVSRTGRLW